LAPRPAHLFAACSFGCCLLARFRRWPSVGATSESSCHVSPWPARCRFETCSHGLRNPRRFIPEQATAHASPGAGQRDTACGYASPYRHFMGLSLVDVPQYCPHTPLTRQGSLRANRCPSSCPRQMQRSFLHSALLQGLKHRQPNMHRSPTAMPSLSRTSGHRHGSSEHTPVAAHLPGRPR
jgi:hypothetical protein